MRLSCLSPSVPRPPSIYLSSPSRPSPRGGEAASDCLPSPSFLSLPLTERVQSLLSDCDTNYLYLIINGALNVNQEDAAQPSVSAPLHKHTRFFFLFQESFH